MSSWLAVAAALMLAGPLPGAGASSAPALSSLLGASRHERSPHHAHLGEAAAPPATLDHSLGGHLAELWGARSAADRAASQRHASACDELPPARLWSHSSEVPHGGTLGPALPAKRISLVARTFHGKRQVGQLLQSLICMFAMVPAHEIDLVLVLDDGVEGVNWAKCLLTTAEIHNFTGLKVHDAVFPPIPYLNSSCAFFFLCLLPFCSFVVGWFRATGSGGGNAGAGAGGGARGLRGEARGPTWQGPLSVRPTATNTEMASDELASKPRRNSFTGTQTSSLTGTLPARLWACSTRRRASRCPSCLSMWWTAAGACTTWWSWAGRRGASTTACCRGPPWWVSCR